MEKDKRGEREAIPSSAPRFFRLAVQHAGMLVPWAETQHVIARRRDEVRRLREQTEHQQAWRSGNRVIDQSRPGRTRPWIWVWVWGERKTADAADSRYGSLKSV